jgi:DNA replication and repair protein RecF
LQFESDLVLIEGDNGSGKTSLLEAMHYGCYLRSFRTYNPRHMIAHGQESFFIKMHIAEGSGLLSTEHEIQIGFAGKRRSVKLNQHPISSYKELMDSFRVITVTEDDLGLITGGPEMRRNYLDAAIILSNPLFAKTLSELKRITEHRASLIYQRNAHEELYRLWTEQLWEKSRLVQRERIALLESVLYEAKGLIEGMFKGAYSLDMVYMPKMNLDAPCFQDWYKEHPTLYADEIMAGRSLFGAHLDDFGIKFQDVHSKLYASRGQQKLLVMLIKMAQVKEMSRTRGSVVLLLDDFLTDFDKKRAECCLQALVELKEQLILTSPLAVGCLADMIKTFSGYRVLLD